MDIQTAARYLSVGYRITRPKWRNRFNQSFIDQYSIVGSYFCLDDLLADDWEIDFRDLISDSEYPLYKGEEMQDEE